MYMLWMLVLRKILLLRQKTNSARWTKHPFLMKNVNCNAIIYIENILENEIDRIWQKKPLLKAVFEHREHSQWNYLNLKIVGMLWCWLCFELFDIWMYLCLCLCLKMLLFFFLSLAIRFFWLAIVINDRLTRTNGIYKYKHNCILPQKC